MEMIQVNSGVVTPKNEELVALFKTIEKKARTVGKTQLLMALDRLADLRDPKDSVAATQELSRIANALENPTAPH